MATLADLINAKTSDQVKKEIIVFLQNAGFQATDWENGSQAKTLVEMESTSLAELWTVVSEIAKGMYIETAEGDWLTLLAKSQYELDRIPSEFTIGNVVVTLIPGAGPYSLTGGQLRVSDGLGHFFISNNALPITLNSGTSPVVVPFISETAKAENNVAAGTLTVVNTGPAGITVNNNGLPVAAIVTAATPASPYNVNAQTLIITLTVNNVTLATQTLTFGANYATLALLVSALNTLIGANATLAGKITAQDSGTGQLQLVSVAKGPQQKIEVGALGTANTNVGFDNTNRIAFGYINTDQPASIVGAYLTGPFNLAGTNLKITVTIDGSPQTPQTFNFGVNYADMNAVVTAIGSNITGIIPSNDGGRLKLSTLKTGPSQQILLDFSSTANPILGLSNLQNTVAIGSSAWITQEGRDPETDVSLRARCKARWGILGAGTADAFRTWAREASPKVQKVVVYSNYLNGVPKAGAVTVYVAGTQLALDNLTVDAVYNYILPKMPIMSQLFVGSAVIKPVYYSGTITLQSNFNNDATKNALKNNVTLYSQTIDIGGTAYKKRIESEILRASSGILDLTLSAPLANQTAGKNELIVITEDPLNPIKYNVV